MKKNNFIEFDGKIILGAPSTSSFKMSDLRLACEEIEFNCNRVEVRNYEDDIVYIEAKKYNQARPELTVDCNPKSNLLITWGEGKKYPWTDYYHDFSFNEISLDYKGEIYDLRRILTQFRKHKKNDFARYRDYIDGVIVGSSSTKQSILKYLIEERIVIEDNFIYKLNTDKLGNYGINWDSFRRGQIEESVMKFMRGFDQWKQKQ